MRSGATSPPFRIFLNYRREDSQDAAGRLYDQLTVEFGEDHVFMDVDAIPAGVDFVDHINEAVAYADVFVALIGSRWLNATDASGRRRLDDESDFVRLELEAALARGIPVIPTFVQATSPPAAADLPEGLTKLARIQGQTLSHERWRYDSARLIARFKELQGDKASELATKAAPTAKESLTRRVPSTRAPGGSARQGTAERSQVVAPPERRYAPRRIAGVIGGSLIIAGAVVLLLVSVFLGFILILLGLISSVRAFRLRSNAP